MRLVSMVPVGAGREAHEELGLVLVLDRAHPGVRGVLVAIARPAIAIRSAQAAPGAGAPN